MTYKNYGELICNARKSKHVSQEQLADYLGVSRQAVSNWENNKCYPDISLIPKLCHYLDVNVYEFFDNEKGLKILELEKEKVRKRNNILRIFLTTIIVLFIIICYLIISNNKFSYYSVSIDSNDFVLKNAHFIETNDLYYLDLGNLEHNFNSYVYVRVYTEVGNDRNVILSGTFNNNLVLTEYKGYNEYFDDFNVNKTKLFIEFEYVVNGNKVSVPYILDFNLQFEKSKLFGNNVTKISNDKSSVDLGKKFDVDKLINANYVFDENSGNYYKYVDDVQYTILGCSNSLVIMFNKDNKSYYLEYDSYLNEIYLSEYDNFLGDITLEFGYFINNDNLIVHKGEGNYDYYIDLVLMELELLQ